MAVKRSFAIAADEAKASVRSVINPARKLLVIMKISRSNWLTGISTAREGDWITGGVLGAR